MCRRLVLIGFVIAGASCAVDGPTAMTPCRAADLRAALYGGEGAAGHSNSWLVVYNVGKQPCIVEGPARLVLYDANARVVSLSEGVSPFIHAGPAARTGPFRIDAHTTPESFDGPRAGVVWVSVAQGPCPGGVFPRKGTLEIALADVGRLHVDGFTDSLPFDYRCDVAGRPAAGKPTLLVSRLSGSKPVARATPSPAF